MISLSPECFVTFTANRGSTRCEKSLRLSSFYKHSHLNSVIFLTFRERPFLPGVYTTTKLLMELDTNDKFPTLEAVSWKQAVWLHTPHRELWKHHSTWNCPAICSFLSQVGWGRSRLSGPQQMHWGRATATSICIRPTDALLWAQGSCLWSEQAQKSQLKHPPHKSWSSGNVYI